MRAHSAPTDPRSRERASPASQGARAAAGPRDPGRGGGGGDWRGLGPAPQRRAGAPGLRRAKPLLLAPGVKMAARETWRSPGA